MGLLKSKGAGKAAVRQQCYLTVLCKQALSLNRDSAVSRAMPLTLQTALKTPAATGRTFKAAYKQQMGAALKLLPFERN